MCGITKKVVDGEQGYDSTTPNRRDARIYSELPQRKGRLRRLKFYRHPERVGLFFRRHGADVLYQETLPSEERHTDEVSFGTSPRCCLLGKNFKKEIET